MKKEENLKPGAKCQYYVDGMHCAACEMLIEKKLGKYDGLKNVNAVLKNKKVFFEITKPVEEKKLLSGINKIIGFDGYSIQKEKPQNKINTKDLLTGLMIAIFVVAVFLLLQKLGLVNILNSTTLTLPMVFLIGIVASLSTCMAVVGGLVLSISSNYSKQTNKSKPLIIFHLSRVIGFFILGGMVGLIGSAFTLTPTFFLIMSILLFVVMLILGINLLDIFPGFKMLQLRMPKFITKGIVKNENFTGKFTPLLLGVITFFLPCGFTQSMQFNAMTSGSIIQGALIMFTFSLGTLPVLALLSFTSFKLGESKYSGVFFKTAGFLVLFFALINFISALVSTGVINPIF